MDILLVNGFLSAVTISYATLTGLTLFNSDVKLENPNKLFFNSSERENRYQDYNRASFALAISILVANIILFILVKWYRKNLNLAIFYIYSLFFLLLAAIYYGLIGGLIFKDLQLNSNYISKQSILNWIYAFILFISAIAIIISGKKLNKNNQKSSSSGSTKPSSLTSS